MGPRPSLARATWVATVAVLLLGCSDEPPRESSTGEPAPDAGVPCAAGELTLEDGSCRAAGVPPELCAAGFESDGAGGCVALVPATCPPGLMAVPGDSMCREVAPCADGTWGGVPSDDDTEFVDASYRGVSSDGSQAHPWVRIQDGIDAAPPGGVVAVAAGTYAETLRVSGKPVRIWGRCPALVEVAGTGTYHALEFDGAAASGGEVHRLALTGDTIGLSTFGAQDILAEQVWVHDTQGRGIISQRDGGPASILLRASLVEGAVETGVFLAGAGATVESSVVRGTRGRSTDGKWGHGIDAQDYPVSKEHSALIVRASVVEQNRDIGVFVLGSDATLEGALVRDTQAEDDTQRLGVGLMASDDFDTLERSSLVVRSSLVERNRYGGVAVYGSDADIDGLIVRDTLPQASDADQGRGLVIADDEDTGARSNAVVRSSLIERSREAGVFILDSEATLEAVAVRDTYPAEASGAFGIGIALQSQDGAAQLAAVTLRSCSVDRSHYGGIQAADVFATLEATAVRVVALQGDWIGQGITIFDLGGARSTSVVRGSLVEDVFHSGIQVQDSEVTIEDTVVRRVQSSPTLAVGDGIAAIARDADSKVTITGGLVAECARAGISTFGASVSVSGTSLQCNAIALDGETFMGRPWSLQDGGGNVCGCQGATSVCQVSTSQLSPPQPLLPL